MVGMESQWCTMTLMALTCFQRHLPESASVHETGLEALQIVVAVQCFDATPNPKQAWAPNQLVRQLFIDIPWIPRVIRGTHKTGFITLN